MILRGTVVPRDGRPYTAFARGEVTSIAFVNEAGATEQILVHVSAVVPDWGLSTVRIEGWAEYDQQTAKVIAAVILNDEDPKNTGCVESTTP